MDLPKILRVAHILSKLYPVTYSKKTLSSSLVFSSFTTLVVIYCFISPERELSVIITNDQQLQQA